MPSMMILPVAFFALAPAATAPAEAVAARFFTAYLKQPVNAGVFEGVRPLRPLMTKRLLKILDDAAACQKDWGRQQPKGSTDKPPFVDCCLFASSPEGLPTAFQLGSSEPLPDHRDRVYVSFTYAEKPTPSDPAGHLQMWRWRDAVIVAREGGESRIDDFVYLRDAEEQPPRGGPELLSESFKGCSGGRWTGSPE